MAGIVLKEMDAEERAMKKRTCADRLEQNQESLRGGLKGERRTHMTLSQIIAQALRQLGEDPQDVSEYEETFKIYANVGYDIAVREYLKPRREMCLDIDGNGRAPVVGVIVNRVIRMTDEDGGTSPLIWQGTEEALPYGGTT